MVQELLSLALSRICPVPLGSVVHPSPLHIDCGCVLHESTSLLGTKVPHRVHSLVLGQVLGQVVGAAGDDVDHPAGQVARLEHLVEVRLG